MTGSKFVGGILSSGIEVELAKVIREATKNYANQMQEEGAFLLANNNLGLANSNLVGDVQCKQADADEAQAWGQFSAGVTQIGGAASSVATRSYREGLFGGPQEFKDINEQDNHIGSCESALHGGDSDVVDGDGSNPEDGIQMANLGAPKPSEPNEITDKDLFNLKNKPVKEYTKDDKEILKTLSKSQGARVKDADGNDMTREGKACDAQEKKLDKAREQNSSRRSRYDAESQRISDYLASITRAAGDFSTAGGGLDSAAKQRQKAALSTVQTETENAAQLMRSGADMTLQSAQGSAQLISETNRARAEFGPADKA